MRFPAAIVICGVCLATFSCDREKTVPPTPTKRTPTLGVELTRVTSLSPAKRTHLAPGLNGQAYWVQESEGGRETVFAANEGGLPVATRLANASILETLGKSDGHGSIQSLAVGPDRKLYFYFSGVTRRELVTAFGCFVPETGKTQILAERSTLMQESRMGDALALARGSIVRVGDVLWLWLRHTDGYTLLSLDLGRIGSGLRRTFEMVRANGEELRLTSPDEDLSPGPNNSLLYLERSSGRLWKISPLGEAIPLIDLESTAQTLSTPALDEQGRLVFFQWEATTTASSLEESLSPAASRPATEFPALLIIDPAAGNRRTVLGRETFSAPDRINLRTLVLKYLFRDRSGWLAYDSATGELLHLKVVER